MTDAALVAKKLAEIETYVRELRELADAAAIASSVKEQRFVLHTLQLAIQAAINAASHVVSDERLGEPESNRQLFALLTAAGWVPSELGARLEEMAGFRNVLVHEYASVDLEIVRNVLETRLDDLLQFAAAMRRRLSAQARLGSDR
jgi:uncharacterized protein YutE (UPF0331/DUF86 family)